jgi:Protein of unknown function (DUF2752)
LNDSSRNSQLAFPPRLPNELYHLGYEARATNQQFERWFLVGSLAFIVGCFGWLYFGLPWPKCWLRHLFGVPCPTCGSTRCALALLQGHLAQAFLLNPLSFVLYLAVLLTDLYAAAVVFLNAPVLRLKRFEIKKTLAITLSTLVIVNWSYLLAHR